MPPASGESAFWNLGAEVALSRAQADAMSRHREPSSDRLWVNAERTVMARLWASGTVEVAVRSHPSETWGPPFLLTEEK
jgi:hypothetical protein